MTPSPHLEARVGALIAAYADQAPTTVDAMAVTRLAAAQSSPGPRAWWSHVPISRWLRYGIVVLALLAAIVAGALAAGGQLLRRDPVSVIAHYGALHRGYVFVYADGQVVLYRDIGPTLPVGVGASRYSILERRLTQEGVDFVRSGAIVPSAFLTPQLPESAWADPEYTAYAPSSYAICDGNMEEPDDAGRSVSRLPAPAQALLRGKERTYQETDAGLGESPPVTCFEVTAEQAHILVDLLADAGFKAEWFGPQPSFLDVGSEGGFMRRPARSGLAPEAEAQDSMIWFKPILPHGTWVFWGG